MASAADRELLVSAFESCSYPSGKPTLDTAWLGIYQLLLWYEENPLLRSIRQYGPLLAAAPPEIQTAVGSITSYLERDEAKYLLHIREANDLERNATWQRRAGDAEEYIARALGILPAHLPASVDLMMKLPRWQGLQRNNPLGNGLRILAAHVLARWGSAAFTYEEEKPATTWFPGIQMPGRSQMPYVDVGVIRNGVPRALVSCKWSIRHDRVSDPTNECQEYRAAASRRQWRDLGYYVLTNELDGQRLDKLLNQPCIDGVVHVHLDLAVQVVGATTMMRKEREQARLLDLADFVRLTQSWT